MSKAIYCHSCKKSFGIFRWRYRCSQCQHIFCSDCLYKDVIGLSNINKFEHNDSIYCISCGKTKASKVTSLKIKSFSVITVKSAYVGQHVILENIGVESSGGWYKNPNDAIDQLKYKAAKKEANAIVELKLEKDTNSKPGKGKGTYYYSVFKARGKLVKVIEKPTSNFKSKPNKSLDNSKIASELEKLIRLHDRGLLTNNEYKLAKDKLINS